MLPVEQRAAEGTRIAHHLCHAIAKFAPNEVPGDLWERVGPSDRAFMAALHRWQKSGTEEDKQALRVAYRDVIAAWRSALGLEQKGAA